MAACLGRPISWSIFAMLCNIVSHCGVLTLAAASHVDQRKRVAWFSISMQACGSVPTVTRLHLVDLWATGAPLMGKTTNLVCFEQNVLGGLSCS